MINRNILKVISSFYENHSINMYNMPESSPDIKEIIRSAARSKGLKVSVNDKNTYFYKKDIYVGGLVRNRSSFVTSEVAKMCRQKNETLNILKKKNIPVATGKLFNGAAYDEALCWVKEQKSNVVVKPANFEGGKGVTINVDASTLHQAWVYCVNTLKEAGRKNIKIIVEHCHPGIDIRVLVINQKCICASTRLPANVIGDGKKPIRLLIKEKNNLRFSNPYLKDKLIVVDDRAIELLEKQSLTVDSAPKKGKVVLLGEITNNSFGADPVDVTDLISDQIKKLAIKATQAIHGLAYAGVDIIAPSYSNDHDAIVNEVNTYNDIRMHYYPLMGKPRNPADHLVNYYLEKYELFKKLTLSDLNLNLQKAIDQQNDYEAIALLHHVLSRHTNPKLELFVRLAKLYLECDNVDKFEKTLRNACDFCEEERNIIEDVISINRYGQSKTEKSNRRLERNIKILEKSNKQRSTLKKRNQSLKQKNQTLKNKIDYQNLKIKQVKGKYKHIKESKTWRYTRPLRRVIGLIKGEH